MKIYTLLPGKIYQRGEFIKASLVDKKEFLKSTGIDVIVNVWTHEDTEIIPYLDEYIYYPMADGPNFDPIELDRLSEYIADIVVAKHKVLIHCHAGRNRSSLVTAMTLMKLLGWHGHKAIRYVMECRPNAFGNKHYVEFLEGL